MTELARCSTDPACPTRWAAGPSRPCGQHHGAAALREASRMIQAEPGRGDQDDEQ